MMVRKECARHQRLCQINREINITHIQSNNEYMELLNHLNKNNHIFWERCDKSPIEAVIEHSCKLPLLNKRKNFRNEKIAQ